MVDISIITVVKNNVLTISECIFSVWRQSNQPYEHIIVDGKSTDGTLDEINKFTYPAIKVISEADQGIYDAMNKGIRLAQGGIIGILNSDDLYNSPDVLKLVAEVFEDPSIDACYSDLVYVDRSNTDQVVRYWKSKNYSDGMFEKGWVPPHPTFFVRREIYEKCGLFDLNIHIAADFELMLRFMAKYKIRTYYLPQVTVRMRLGGTTNKSLQNIIKQNMEILSAIKNNGLRISLFFPVYKLVEKLSQYFARPSNG